MSVWSCELDRIRITHCRPTAVYRLPSTVSRAGIPTLLAMAMLGLAACTPFERPGNRLQVAPPPTATPAAPLVPALRTGAEEVWIVARTAPAAPPTGAAPQVPALPYLQVRDDGAVLPLQHTTVHAAVAGHVASVDLRQRFHNAGAPAVEAEYVFALPLDAAVDDFVITIGTRTIRGYIRERSEAEVIYADARKQGRRAFLLTQERPGVFRQAVANIAAGQTVDVSLTYFHTLSYRDGELEWLFPMRDAAAASSIELSADIDAGAPIATVHSPSHQIVVERPNPERARVQLAPQEGRSAADFVLRFGTAGDDVRFGLLTHRDARGGFFSLLLQPPADISRVPRQALELIAIADCSARMAGAPMAGVRAAIKQALRQLDDGDRFNLHCSTESWPFADQARPADAAGRAAAIAWIESQNGNGSSPLREALRAALAAPPDPSRRRVVMLLGDGRSDDDGALAGVVREQRSAARILSVAIGAVVDVHELVEVARLGRGAVAQGFTGAQTWAEIDAFIGVFLEGVRRPVLSDLEIDSDGLELADLHPAQLPDLLAGRPLVVTGRFRGNGPAVVRIHGNAAGAATAAGNAGAERRSLTLKLSPAELAQTHPALATLWARASIAALEYRGLDQAETSGGDGTSVSAVVEQIRNLGLDYHIVSTATAFIAIDARAQAEE